MLEQYDLDDIFSADKNASNRGGDVLLHKQSWVSERAKKDAKATVKSIKPRKKKQPLTTA